MKKIVIQLIDTEEKKCLDDLTIIKGKELVETKDYSGIQNRYIVLYKEYAQIENETTIVGKLLDIINEFNN